MKWFNLFQLAMILLMGVGCSRQPDAGSLQTFLEAQSAFEEAEKMPSENRTQQFRKAAILFQSLADQGVRSGQIYYNLGNAWMQAEEPAQALAAYHLAKRYRPLDPYLASNMQTVLGGSVPPEQTKPVIEYVFFWQNWIGCQGKKQCSLILITVTFLTGTIWLFFPLRRFRRLAVFSAVLTLISAGSVGYDWYRFDYLQYAIIETESVPRKGNSEQYEPVFTSAVPFGTVAVVLDERADWQHLRFPLAQDGWLPKKQVINYK
jgi:tetratricopeptide (TPR) repeat protein